MKSGIQLQKIWFDDDIVELSVRVCDGKSLFSNTVYIGADAISKLVEDLKIFRNQIHGGFYDLEFGGFGPETANGGFRARLHFYPQGKGLLYISTHQESSYETFKDRKVASEACMYLKTEPSLLDNFISEIQSLNVANSEEANLVCLSQT